LPYLYKDELLAEAIAILDRAERLADSDPTSVQDRIAFLRDGLEFLRLTRDTVDFIWAESRPEGITERDVEQKIKELSARGDELSERHVMWGDIVMKTMKRRGILSKKRENMNGL